MDVHGPRLARIREAPDVLEEPVAGEDDAGLSAERLEELEFFRAERYRTLADEALVARRIGPHVPDLERPAAAGHARAAAKDRSHACDVLLWVERLREVVVHALLESLDLLHVLGTRGKREHRRVRLGAGLAEELHA